MKGRTRAVHGMLGAVALTAGLLAGAPAAVAAEGDIQLAAAGTAVPGQYLVVLKDEVGAQAADLTAKHGGTVTATWRHALRGFAVNADEREARRLAADPAVRSVSQNGLVQATDTQLNPPSWGLDRIDQNDLPLNSAFNYRMFSNSVRAYVIDTGIRTTHSTFGGRASWGYDAVDGSNTDCNGHGTHVAGTVGGSQYGVAKYVRLVAVRVLGCTGSGTFAQVISGVEWVTANAVKPAIANMSLGALASAATAPLETAVRNSIASGVTYTIASGNSDDDACRYSPALVREAITVNASTITDARASFSNYGRCTDIFAPGVNIKSSWHTSDTATATSDGTSMAAPHVAGVAALYLSARPAAPPADVHASLVAAATPNKITNPGEGSPNRLAHTGRLPSFPATVTATRYVGVPGDHLTSVTGAPSGYVFEQALGRLSTTWTPGTHPLYRCKYNNWDSFTAFDVNCEGHAFIGLLGYAYDIPIAGSHPIYRCIVRNNADHMESYDANCEGQITEANMGYFLD
ncbi:S8 family peptidase [Saccharothrix longispora]|uniref:Subtilisin family serine protease n=1 Tax=Saccharothrix longispora TaxID=33920 RepID=A0ABU1PUZ7_9PSEU|nr:S8 family peptidase [Saccharothrix longispora]MDR6594431.1 subtilisin family serine protease [Saccharothrix longispora]